MKGRHPVILILGPTAGGKTRLAIDLANRLPGGGECLGADSMQVYRGMDIGTAKPTPEERAQAPHHLFDIADPSQGDFSVDTWLGLADQTIEEVRSRGHFPIIVGGTNLYVQAFLEGLFEGPEPDQEIRAKLTALSAEELRAALEECDPEAASRIHPNDRKRSIRAIEVFELTGKRLSDLQQQWSQGPPRDDVIIIGLEYPAESINQRINARVKSMMEEGLLEEVRTLFESDRLGPQAR
ncbi:MAG: tRNA (adenosine(37)-N6)-dimethylallyltransferase MiaA, partial [Planctomycetota bacterium]|nr:tRNA (adenosine(37)-N6)-dimethylallyltransferase MiaA [Planctomycetota bacterium]